jgi:hypothetical protein
MYTVETDFDETKIVILDDSGDLDNEDLEVVLTDDYICFKQWDYELDETSIIIISNRMWEELLCAINSSDGAYSLDDT